MYCSRIQSGINGWLKNRAGLARGFPNAVWYASKELGGVGELELFSEINIEKVLIFLRGLVRGVSHQDKQFLELEEVMTQEKCGEARPVFMEGGSNIKGGMGTWGCSLAEFLRSIDASIPGGGELAGRRHSNDWTIVSLATTDKEREQLRQGCCRYRVWWGSYLLDCSAGERWRWGLGSVAQDKRRLEWENLILLLGSEQPGVRGGVVRQHLQLGEEGWLPINHRQEGEWYAGRDSRDRSRMVFQEVRGIKQGVVVVKSWIQKAGGGIGKNNSVSAKSEWDWLASEWEGARLQDTHWERVNEMKYVVGAMQRVEMWVSRGGKGVVGQLINRTRYCFQPGQFKRGREMVRRVRLHDNIARRERELVGLAGVGMEEVEWWTLQYDSL